MKSTVDRTADVRIYEFGDFRLDTGRRQLLLSSDGRVLPLNARAFDTLLLFVQHRGEVLDKGTLMTAIWPDVIVEENNLNQSISAVRRMLGDSRDQHRYIITIPGVGYQFVSDVKVLTDEATSGTAESSRVGFAGSGAEPDPKVEPATAAATPVVPADADTGASPDAPDRRQLLSTNIARPAVRWAGVVAVLLVAGALMWAFGHRAERQTAAQSAPTPAPESPTDGTAPRLAVLPFTNLSPEPANAFFADGLHEEILSTLAERIPGIAVISRTTMMSYRQTPKPLGEVARELGATHVIEGTVRREGSHVRLTLQLVDAGIDRYIWSQTYDRALASAMTLQSEVAADVATQLSVRLAGDVAGTKPITRDAEAYDLYLRALLSFRELNFYDDSRKRALEDVLNRALVLDPGFAQAYAQRARLHSLLFISGMDTSDRNYRSISADVAAARRLAPNDPIALAAFGYFMLVGGQFSRSIEAIESAEAAGLRDPAWLIPKTRALLSLGRVDDAIKVHEQMLSVDPANPLVLVYTAFHMLLVQRPDMTLRVSRLAAETFPDLANIFRGYALFAARGDLQALHKAVAPILADSNLSAPQLRDPDIVSTNCEVLRLEHRYPELVEFLKRVPAPSLPFNGDLNEIFDSVGERPVAEQLGWAYLLFDKPALAREQGKAVLAFVAGQSETKFNRFYLRLLAATGYTFLGQKQEAITTARAGLALMPRSENAVAWVGATALGARVYAWNGAGDDAVKLLAELASSAPGKMPAQIARDPLFTVPLAKNAGFQSLVAKLEEQMRNTRL